MDNDLITIDNDGLEFLCEHTSDLEGFEFYTARNTYIDPPNRGGTTYITSRPGRRILAWRGLITTDIGEKSRLLARVCRLGNLKTIKFTTCDGLQLQCMAEIDVLLNPYRRGRRVFQLQLTAPDYRFYSQVQYSVSLALSRSSAGVPIPAAIPSPIPRGNLSSITVTNNGNEETEPDEIIIHGPGTDFTVQNTTTGEILNIDLTLSSSESVVIKPSENSAYVGSEAVFGSVSRTPAGRWLTIQPGVNTYVFRARSGGNDNTVLTLKWRDAYGGT